MNDNRVDDLSVESIVPLITPKELKQKRPISEEAIASVQEGRQTIRNILDHKDHRLFLVIGPCSIHDVEAAKEYAVRLKELSEKVSDTLYLVMRVYFEKPRTTVGWKGLINDPYMNDTFKIEEGLEIGRNLLLELSEMGLALSTEALDPISPQYIQDLISWSAIGARTTESQTHREMASGLSSPVGFKNGTDGNLTVAINALESVANSHSFLGINKQGQVAIIRTKGNKYGHVVLRGGSNGPNFNAEHVKACEEDLAKAGLSNNIMIDCSHANSEKDPGKQPAVVENVIEQIKAGNQSVVGLMIESNIGWGNQKISDDKSKLQYGVSITDPCIDWEATEKCMLNLADQLRDILPGRIKR